MADRTRSEPLVIPEYDVIYKVQNTGPPLEDLPVLQYDADVVTKKFERVSMLPPKGHPTFNSWNPFEHYVRTLEDYGGSFRFVTYRYYNYPDPYNRFPVGQCSDARVGWIGTAAGVQFGGPSIPLNGLPDLYLAQSDGRFVRTHVDEEELATRAFMACLPDIPPKLSLINSLIELKDFKSLPKTLAGVLAFRKKGNWTLRKILHAGADGYLQTQFNILPLLKDISNLRKALKDTTAQVDKLLEDVRKRRTKHTSFGLGGVFKDVDETSYSPDGNDWVTGHYIPDYLGYCKGHRNVRHNTPLFHAQLEYSFDMPDWSRREAQIRGHLDSLGVNLNPAIIWNAIPWSFVVDWVIGVSQWLNNNRISNMGIRTTIHRWCWSVKVDRTITCSKDTCIDGPYAQYSIPVSRVREVAYKRSTWMPDPHTAIFGSGLSLTELSLGAALGVSKAT
jgi:hypothetical protein